MLVRPRQAGAGQRDVMCTSPWRRSSRTPIPSESTLQALRPGPEAASTTCLCGSPRQALAHPEAQIPIGNRLRPAGSCMRDFVRLTAPETLQHFGHRHHPCSYLKEDVGNDHAVGCGFARSGHPDRQYLTSARSGWPHSNRLLRARSSSCSLRRSASIFA